MKTYIPKPKDIHSDWLLIDASGWRLGRLATRVAGYLRGKHRPIFTPFLDTGDYVIIVNAEKVDLSGNKIDQKRYFRHSTYPGGGKFTTMRHAMAKKPEWVVHQAIWGMLPHNALGRKLIRKLKVYRGPEHPHQAQQPIEVGNSGLPVAK